MKTKYPSSKGKTIPHRENGELGLCNGKIGEIDSFNSNTISEAYTLTRKFIFSDESLEYLLTCRIV